MVVIMFHIIQKCKTIQDLYFYYYYISREERQSHSKERTNMKKVIAILVLAFGFSFADDFDMDGRMIPDFKINIQKGDTDFNIDRQVNIQKITFNDSSIVIDKKVEKVPTFKISQVNIINQNVSNYGME